MVEIRPRVSGFVDKVHFRDGQIIKAGDVLFTIDPRPFEIAVDSAKAEVTRTEAQVQLAEGRARSSGRRLSLSAISTSVKPIST
jgi:multidrug resistance efflux pump